MKTLLFRAFAVIASLLGGAAVFAFLSISAGRWDIPMFMATSIALALVVAVASLFADSGMAMERFRPGPGGRDRFTLMASKLLMVGSLLIAGWDVGQHHWSDSVPLTLQIVSLVFFTAGIAVMEWAMVVNLFFSTLIRHQTERGHRVVTEGPYRLVRHPGYAGAIVAMPLMGLALGSWLAAIPAFAFSLLLIRRAAIEDRFLRGELEGYDDYAARVRWRLLPGVW
ncbi:isoprenylcysteine carboxylmethyltransferase family protein [Candidatus Sumerlaeota bacterium]|nr:isoprenylcysteine carboxylmethyltransferase family protein [Candidatus Sumerlaeota bacterium]